MGMAVQVTLMGTDEPAGSGARNPPVRRRELGALLRALRADAGLTVEQALPMIVKTVGDKVAEQGLGKKPRENVVRDAERHFAALDGMLDGNDWLLGDALSVADIAVAPQIRALLYAEEVVPIVEARPRVGKWLERVDEVAPDRQHAASA